MSRVIKFRAWDEQNENMHKDFQFIKSGNDGNDWIIFTSDLQTLQEKKPHPLSNPYFQQQFKIMQFTGLHDKNGVEIYESDIIARADDHSLKCVVKWEHEKKWRGMTDGYVEHRIGFTVDEYFFTLDDCEVIGNICQNPELLK